MSGRSLRQAGLAALPMLLLSQCAPTCAPAPTPGPLPGPPPTFSVPSPTTTSTTAPQPTMPPTPQLRMHYHDMSASFPAGAVATDLTADGRFLTAGDMVSGDMASGGSGRLDLQSGAFTTLASHGIPTTDGRAVVTVDTPTSVALADATSGQLLSRIELPADWRVASLDSASADGQRAGVTAYSPVDRAAIVFDFTARTRTVLDVGLGPGGAADESWRALLSDDGSTAVFTHRSGPFRCTVCTNVYAAHVGSAPQLASPAVNGALSTTGDSHGVAVSPNGRFVLFRTTSTDLAGGRTNTSGHFYVRDLVNDASDELPVPAPAPWDGVVGAISNDAQRVAFDIGRAIFDSGGFQVYDFVAVYDRPMNTLIDLALETAPEFAHTSLTTIEMSADGRRVAFTADGTSQQPRHPVVADLMVE